MLLILKHLPGKHNQKLHAPKKVAPSGIGYKVYGSEAAPATAKELEDLIRVYDYNTLTSEEADVVYNYTGDGYRDLNYYLRNDDLPNWMKLYAGDESVLAERRHDLNVQASIMDSAITRGPRIPENIRVHRHSSLPADVFNSYANLKPGDEFQDMGFVSTSLNPNYAIGTVGFVINVPKGSKGLFVRNLSKHRNENEVILPRRSYFRVASNEYNPRSGKIKLFVDYLGDFTE